MSRTRRFAWGVIVGGLAVAMGLALAGCGRDEETAPGAPERIVFSILSAEGQASAEPQWRPFLEQMSEAVGAPVEPRFAATYTELVQAMADGGVQAGWFSARPAIDAVDGAGAEVLARTVDRAGDDSYRALLIARAGSGLTLDRVLACDRSLAFGASDPQSTSGALAPATFLFNPRAVDPDACFRSTRTDTHQGNAFSVASGVVDVAVSNTVTLAALRGQNPQIASQVEEIWRSPPLPEGAILVRGDLDPALKERLRGFILSYGQGDGVEGDRQRQTLSALGYSSFRAADESYLDPVREMVADQRLAQARSAGDRTAVQAAERQLQALRAKREVQP